MYIAVASFETKMVILHFPRCRLQFLNEVGAMDQEDAFEVYCEFNQG